MILVTGATGFIGRHLVTHLLAEGEAVRVIVRPSSDRSALPTGVEVLAGELAPGGLPPGLGDGVTTCYHLAGPYRGAPDELERAHVGGTRALLDALGPDGRVVLLSSTSVYGWDQRWPADESSPPAPASAYGEAKLAAERLVLARGEGRGVAARSTIVYGPGDAHGMVPRCLDRLRGRTRLFPGDGENRIHLVHVDDLVDGLWRLRDRGEGVFLFAGPRPAPVREILSALAAAAGTPPPRFGPRAAVLRPVAAVNDALVARGTLQGDGPVSRHSVEVATRDRAYAPARGVELGWAPRVELAEGMRSVVAGPAATPKQPAALGFRWQSYLEDEDEGLGTVYERFMLDRLLQQAVERLGATSVLHAPSFGMMGYPGLDGALIAQRGMRVGLADFDEDRLQAAVDAWRKAGLEPEVHVLPGDDPARWPARLDQQYDLCFSFAALWWFDDVAEVVAAQGRWADRGVLVCTPNYNVFTWLRAHLWHRRLFVDELNPASFDEDVIRAGAARAGLREIDGGLFDKPPFPDTSVPLAKVLRSRRPGSASASTAEAWAWSILPYLRGEQPELPDKIERVALFEDRMPKPLAKAWAHHRWTLFEAEASP